MSHAPLPDVPITVIGGRGPHGLALHLWMRDRGLEGSYALVDPAPAWLPLYADGGLARFTDHLRSPRELDFALGDPARAMGAWTDAGGRWRNLPPIYPIYPLGHLALPRAGLAATTLASAGRYLPTILPSVLADAGLDAGRRALRLAPDPLEVAA